MSTAAASPIAPALSGNQPSPTLERRGRFHEVDSMRGLAAWSVLFYHVAFRFNPPTSQFMLYITQRNSGPPAVCVVVFFMISGFVIYRPFVAARWDGKPMPPLLPYATRRIARIVPAYWVALAVAGVWFSLDYVFTPTGFVRYFGFLQLYSRHGELAGGISVAWSLCVEMTFYASLPLLALAARRLGSRYGRLQSELTMIGAMVLTTLVYETVCCIAIRDQSTWKLSVLNFLPGTLDFFAGGMALAVLSVDVERRERRPRWWTMINRRPWLPWLGGFGLLGIAGQIPGRIGYTGWWLSTHELKPLASFLLLLPTVFGEPGRGVIRKFLSFRPFVFLGMISYGFYLWHYQIMLKLQSNLIPHGELYMTVVVTVLSVAAGTLSWYLLEKPVQQLARRWLKARAARRGPRALDQLIATGSAGPPDLRT